MPKIRSLWISSQNFDPMLFKVLKVFTRCFIHYSVLLGLLVSNIHILGHNRKQKAWGRSPAQAIVWGHYLLVVHVPWQFYCSFAVSIWKWFNASKYLLASFMMALYLTCQSVCSSCFGQKKKIPVFYQWMYRWHSVQAQVCAVCIWKCSLVVLGCTLKAKEFVESWLEEKKKRLSKMWSRCYSYLCSQSVYSWKVIYLFNLYFRRNTGSLQTYSKFINTNDYYIALYQLTWSLVVPGIAPMWSESCSLPQTRNDSVPTAYTALCWASTLSISDTAAFWQRSQSHVQAGACLPCTRQRHAPCGIWPIWLQGCACAPRVSVSKACVPQCCAESGSAV